MKNVIQVHSPSKRYRIGLREMSEFSAEDASVFWAIKDDHFEVQAPGLKPYKASIRSSIKSKL